MTRGKMRILAIEAHPDDLVYFYGGTIARLIEQGHDVRVITVTNGDQSTIDPRLDAEEIAGILAKEHQKALNIIGVRNQRFLEGYTNHFIFSSELQLQLRADLIREIRTYKPDTVITFDVADVYEENPDHRLLARLGIQAASFAAYPLVHPEQLEDDLEPHFVARMLLAPTREPDFFVDIEGTPLEKKQKAGAAYRSQLDLMIGELNRRLQVLGVDPGFDDVPNDALWFDVCRKMAMETARRANQFHATSAKTRNAREMNAAEAFRLVFLGAVEKMRDMLPEDCFAL